MDPVNPWLDPADVRRLADRLLRPAIGPTLQHVADPGFGDHFEGFAPAASAAPPPRDPVQRRPTPPPAPPAPLAPPPPAGPRAVAARGPFLDRILRFRSWMISQFATRGLFLLDRDGAVIFDDGSHGELHFLARSLAQSSRRPAGGAGNLHVKVGAEAILEVIPVDSPYGWLVLGTVVPKALSPAAVSAIINALRQVASPPAAPTSSRQ